MTLQNRIVSSESENLILVDPSDNEVGRISKAEAHDGDGILHRAFSLFLFDDEGRLLLQQRGKDKRLWPGYWSNSCCSHPRAGESMQVATRRRLEEELGLAVELEYVYRFQYQARFGEAGSEHELCSVYLGRTSNAAKPNETEIEAVLYLAPVELEQQLAAQPDDFTPWFRQEWSTLRSDYAETLAKYLLAQAE